MITPSAITFEIYLVDGWPHGYEITEKPYPDSLRGYDSTFNFPGRSAHIRIVSNDRGINRSIALCFASAVVHGKVRTRRIDLSQVNNVVSKKGKR